MVSSFVDIVFTYHASNSLSEISEWKITFLMEILHRAGGTQEVGEADI